MKKGRGKWWGRNSSSAAYISHTWSETTCCAVLGAVNSLCCIMEAGIGGSQFFSPLASISDGIGLFLGHDELIDV